MKTTTLEELGNQLPMLLPNGSRPTFSFKPWRFKEEMKISQLKKKHKHFGRFVREVFNFMLSDFDGKGWESYSDGERKILLNQLPLGSVMYMYFYLRCEALGDEIKMTGMVCPQCSRSLNNFFANLKELDVKVQDEGDSKEATYHLKKPFQMGDLKLSGIKFKQTPWDAMEKLSPQDAGDEAAIKRSMLVESFAGVVSEEAGNVDLDKVKVLDGLSKRDIEGSYEFLDSHNGGPVMWLEMSCPSCTHEFNAPIQWDYTNFFSNTSAAG